MSRPRSKERRSAILDAATRVIATQGLGAATAAIAKEAGVSNGSLFVYFDTKSKLFNELYLELKLDMGASAMSGLPVDAEIREQFYHVWTRWMGWATSFPEKRRALAQLGVSEDITNETHQLAAGGLSGLSEMVQRVRAGGPMADEPIGFVLLLVTAIAESTIDAVIREPASGDSHGRAGFAAMWRVLAGTGVTSSHA
jgi:AcrR family transcriptional regulator